MYIAYMACICGWWYNHISESPVSGLTGNTGGPSGVSMGSCGGTRGTKLCTPERGLVVSRSPELIKRCRTSGGKCVWGVHVHECAWIFQIFSCWQLFHNFKSWSSTALLKPNKTRWEPDLAHRLPVGVTVSTLSIFPRTLHLAAPWPAGRASQAGSCIFQAPALHLRHQRC